jgi:transcriptional regulator with XRE-family HTH domain
MARRPKDIDPTESTAALFGAKMREMRLDRGWSPDDLGHEIGCTGDHVSRIELGKRVPDDKIAAGLDRVFGTGTYFQDLQPLVAKEHLREDVRSLAEHEGLASKLYVYEPSLITGLCQTPEYIRTLVLVGVYADEEGEIVAARLRRQRILDREVPPWLVIFLDEVTLRRKIGGAQVMLPQLDRLQELNNRPHITIQIIPASRGAYTGLSTGCTLMTFPEGSDAAYMDGWVGTGRMIHEQATLERIHKTFDLVRAAALPAAETDRLIEEAREAL